MRCTRLTLCFLVLAAASCGSVSSTHDGGSGSDTPPPTKPVLDLIAGAIVAPGTADGTGSAARFNSPNGVAVDGNGNVYVVDTGNHNIRKITPAGVVTTLAGTAGVPGNADKTGTAARFNNPNGIAIDSLGNLYVADSSNSTIREITPGGAVSTLAGLAGNGGSADGTGPNARFFTPVGIAIDSADNLYVADFSNNNIRKVTPGGVVTTLAGLAGTSGSTDSPTGSMARFLHPTFVAVDAAGNVYVTDTSNQTIRKVTPAGAVTTVAGAAGMPGITDSQTGTAARFSSPEGMAIDSAGNVYIADNGNDTIRKMTPAGAVSTFVGVPGTVGNADGGTAARFFRPTGVAIDKAGNLYVTDRANGTVRIITIVNSMGTVGTLAGTPFVFAGGADGPGPTARFNSPGGISADSMGNLYVADTNSHTIRAISPAGVVTTPVGIPGLFGSTDGTGGNARFEFPSSTGVDSMGNVYVADTFNHTIRKITPLGVVSTLAGTAGVIGSADNPTANAGANARFSSPSGVAVDPMDNIYVADTNNSTIRKITTAGVVTTLVGVAGVVGSADGGTSARFNHPTRLTTDSAGNIYVADNGNSTIRAVTPSGVVSTLAGTPGVSASMDGLGPAAQFNNPNGTAVDAAGNIYIADTRNCTIRKLTPAGETSTIVGIAGQGTTVLGAAPQLTAPIGLVVVKDGLVIVDANAILVFHPLP